MGLRDLLRNLKDKVEISQNTREKSKAKQQQKANGDDIKPVDPHSPM